MLFALLAKDFARARRNPWPWVINMIIPLVVVAIIGLAFGGAANGEKTLGRMRFAVVDEDNTVVSRLLRGTFNQSDLGTSRRSDFPVEPVLMERTPALAELKDNKLSSVIVIPLGFTDDFLDNKPVTLELVKNPAESIKPTLMEEALGALSTALDALGRNFAPELKDLRAALSDNLDRPARNAMMIRWADRFEELAPLVETPLIGYKKPSTSDSGDSAKGDSGGYNIFGYLLFGMAAMFLLFLGSVGMGDLHREIELRTLARFQTLHVSLTSFIASKVAFATMMLLLCAAILFCGGGLVFGVTWHHPLQLAILSSTFAFWTTGLMAVLVAWLPDQRKGEAIRSMACMVLAMAGGCAFPIDQFPPVFHRFVLPVLPTHWFVSTARALEYGGGAPWAMAALKLTIVGAALLTLAAVLFRRHFAKGGRA